MHSLRPRRLFQFDLFDLHSHVFEPPKDHALIFLVSVVLFFLLRLVPVNMEEEGIDGGIDDSEAVHIEQRVGTEVRIALIMHTVRKLL